MPLLQGGETFADHPLTAITTPARLEQFRLTMITTHQEGSTLMGSNDTPPYLTALFDQQEATQNDQDQLPDGVVAQVRIRRLGEGHDGLAASFTMAIPDGDPWLAAAVLLTLEGVAREFGEDVARGLSQLAGEGIGGLIEAGRILEMVIDGRKTLAGRVKRAADD